MLVDAPGVLSGLGVEGDEHGLGAEADGEAVTGHIGPGAADEDQQVRLGESSGHGIGATVAEPTGPGRRVMGHGVIGAPVAEDRDPGRGGEAGEIRSGPGLPAVAAEDERRT